MRRPRVILFEEGAETKKALKQFFEAGGYETIVVAQFDFCPFYRSVEASRGASITSCCDLVVIGNKGPHVSSARLLTSQTHHCSIPEPHHKAIITGASANDCVDAVKAGDVAVFHDPLDLDEFGKWVRSCQERMDLTIPLLIMRKAPRLPCSADTKVHYRVMNRNEINQARALNLSSCGICIRTRHSLKLRQVIHLWSKAPLITEDAEVRWIQPAGDGSLLIGLTFCVD
ncbi:MAG TPA: PilZ domain-containing protein [Nitrospirota bacterium]|nr:PilZ domain-containing protein [Nitrospirota bacterium]